MRTEISLRWTLGLTCCLALGGCASRQATTTRPTTASGRFAARHEFTVTVPPACHAFVAWLPLPAGNDPDQHVEESRVQSTFPTRRVHDSRGNEFLLVEATDPPAGPTSVVSEFTIVRDEIFVPVDPLGTRPHTTAELASLAADLEPLAESVIDDDVRGLARSAVGSETNPVLVARRLYDAVLAHVEYHVKDPKSDAQKTMQASGRGSSRHAFETCTGNCTDIHSLYAAMARASGLPTRDVYGSFFKGPLDGKDSDQSYHCWIEFHAPGLGWIPLDVAVADLFVAEFHANENSLPRVVLTTANGYTGPDPRKVDYYFGGLDERRVVWHRGRDLRMLEPTQSGPPLRWNATGYAECDGVPTAVRRKLTYSSVL